MRTLETAAMEACDKIGVIYSDTPADGNFHYLDVEGKGRRSGDGRIRLYPDGEGGQVWNHVAGETQQFWVKSEEGLSKTELEVRRQRAKEEREKAENEISEKREVAANKAATVWRAACRTAKNPYLVRKQLEPTGTVREIPLQELVALIGYHPQARGEYLSGGRVLIVPVSNGARLATVEMIDEAGRKTALSGGQKGGGYWATGELPEGDGTGVTLGIGEGVATMMTFSMACGDIGIAALSCGNLKAVSLHFRERYPKAKIIVVSDVGNGERSAVEAAEAAKACLAVPVFPKNRGPKDTDLNDLYVLAGIDVVRQQVEAALFVGPVQEEENNTPVKKENVPFSMAELVRKEFRPIQWAVPGLLPEGLAILSGPPKIGKSWLVMDLCIAVSSGGYALGHFKAPRGRVLLLSLEDSDRRLKSRLESRLASDQNADLTQFDGLTTWERLDRGGLHDLDAYLQANPDCKLVVIDTIQKIKAKPTNKNGNAYENDYEAYGGVQRLALERQCCILLVHHNRKSDSRNEADPLEAISGSTGITGTMDTIMMLRRPRGAEGAVLTITGRDIADNEYGLKFDRQLCGWTVTGQPAELRLQEGSNTSRIMALMRERMGQMMTVQEVFEGLGEDVPWETVKRELYRLAGKKLLCNLHGKFALKPPVSLVSPVTLPEGHSDTSDMMEGIGDSYSGGVCEEVGIGDSDDTGDRGDTIGTVTRCDADFPLPVSSTAATRVEVDLDLTDSDPAGVWQ